MVYEQLFYVCTVISLDICESKSWTDITNWCSKKDNYCIYNYKNRPSTVNVYIECSSPHREVWIRRTLKGHRHDWGQCLFTKIIWHEILIDFSQKVIQNCTNHFGKDWAINRAEITH